MAVIAVEGGAKDLSSKEKWALFDQISDSFNSLKPDSEMSLSPANLQDGNMVIAVNNVPEDTTLSQGWVIALRQTVPNDFCIVASYEACGNGLGLPDAHERVVEAGVPVEPAALINQ